MSAARKPRPIGPQAAPAQPSAETDAAQEFNFEAFINGLSAGDLMDLDEVAGGAVAAAMAGGELRVTLKLMFGIAWIVRRRDEPRLTFAQVRRMNPDELTDLLNVLDEGLAPKASSASGS